MEILITSVIVNRFFPKAVGNFVEVYGSIETYLYVYDVNLDGTKQKCLKFDVPHALANGTVEYGWLPSQRKERPPDAITSVMIELLTMVPNLVISSESVFGYVNDNLITRALKMLMQTNADLYF